MYNIVNNQTIKGYYRIPPQLDCSHYHTWYTINALPTRPCNMTPAAGLEPGTSQLGSYIANQLSYEGYVMLKLVICNLDADEKDSVTVPTINLSVSTSSFQKVSRGSMYEKGEESDYQGVLPYTSTVGFFTLSYMVHC